MKMKKRFLSILLSLVMVLGLMPGMSLTAYAAELPHTFNDSGNYEGSWNYSFPNSIDLSKITKIEVLMDIESFPENGWGQVGYTSSDDPNETAKRKLAVFDTSTSGIKKYTAGDGFLDGVNWAGVQLVGKGRLLAYTITFNDNSSSTAGDWCYPEYTVPAGLTATVGQTLADVTLPTATNGTWTWADGNTSVGGVGTNTFSAIFTPNDNSLHTVTNITVPVTV
jgi:hypothetical protein